MKSKITDRDSDSDRLSRYSSVSSVWKGCVTELYVTAKSQELLNLQMLNRACHMSYISLFFSANLQLQLVGRDLVQLFSAETQQHLAMDSSGRLYATVRIFVSEYLVFWNLYWR